MNINLQAAGSRAPAQHPVQPVAAALKFAAQLAGFGRTRSDLSGLSDHQLRDLGIRRGDVAADLVRPRQHRDFA